MKRMTGKRRDFRAISKSGELLIVVKNSAEFTFEKALEGNEFKARPLSTLNFPTLCRAH